MGFSRGAPRRLPSPLLSAASSAAGSGRPLTPPLRLRDRKFLPSLPSVLRPWSRSPSPPLTPLTPAYNPQTVFPSSPICSPTTSKLIPRHERTARGYTRVPPPVSSASSFSLPIHIPGPITHSFRPGSQGSASSYGGTSFATTTGTGTGTVAGTAHSSLRNELSTTATTTTTNNNNPFLANTTATSPKTPLLSPSRPRRPHDEPLEIPDLLTPASLSPPLSPPPNRALPRPPSSAVSPASGGGRSVTGIGGGGGGGRSSSHLSGAVRSPVPVVVVPVPVRGTFYGHNHGYQHHSLPVGYRQSQSQSQNQSQSQRQAERSVSAGGSAMVSAAGGNDGGGGSGVGGSEKGRGLVSNKSEADHRRGSWDSWSGTTAVIGVGAAVRVTAGTGPREGKGETLAVAGLREGEGMI
ncbi:hypothetical protein VTK56DRAFT_8347 [Thermocarpiscus australiensis]